MTPSRQDSPRGVRVAAVVVTYNRRELLAGCLDSLRAQSRPPDRIYAIDNASTDGTGGMVRERYGGSVTYEPLPENTGCSGGVFRGMELAYGAGYDWIWVMDDDAAPSDSCLERLLQHAEPATGFVAPIIVGQDGEVQSYHHKIHDLPREERLEGVPRRPGQPGAIPIDGNAFVGPLINRAAVDAVGLPLREYFILCDDNEYTYRISRRMPCFLAPSAVVIHHDAGNKRTPRPYRVTWKAFYYTRNTLDFKKRVDGPIAALGAAMSIAAATAVKAVAGYYQNPRYACRCYISAAWSGLTGRFRNDWHLTSAEISRRAASQPH